MAKKKKKKKKTSVQTNVQYEIYGVILVVISVIAISGQAAVGRSLAKFCGLLLGKVYFIIPLFFIFMALKLMIKRKWEVEWTSKKLGLVLITLALALYFSVSALEKVPVLSSSHGFQILHQDLTKELLTSSSENSIQTEPSVYEKKVGGGYIGAFSFYLLFWLFGMFGVKLFLYLLFLIGIMLSFSFSYVEIAKFIKNFIAAIINWISATTKDWAEERRARKLQELDDDDEEEIVEEAVEEVIDEIAEVKKPVFFDVQTEPVIRNFQEKKVEEEKAAPVEQEDIQWNVGEEKEKKPYQLPGFQLLSPLPNDKNTRNGEDYKQIAKKLESTLQSFGVKARVAEVVRGPAVTRYEIQPDVGVKVSRIVGLTDDIALALAAKDIRMEAPIPGKSAIGIEVPNAEVSVVTMREVMETKVFKEAESKLSVALGRDISGQTIIGNLVKMPHLLVAGATGSGKSVCINGIITSVLYKAKPDEVKFLMVDPKMVELNVYNGIPHLLAPVVTDPKRAALALKKVVVEMEKRYDLFSKSGTRNIEGYNQTVEEKLPYIIVIVDELADLMIVAAKDVEDSIARLAQMARAAGIHLIIATQRPSVDVITGVIKANIPSRIAFGVSSQIDSRTILDMSGAEKLLGRGDMLFLPMGASKPTRVQGAFLSDPEVEKVVTFVSSQAEAEYNEEIVPEIDETVSEEEPVDELFDQAVTIVLEAKQASVSLLQRRMRVGYTRAARLIDAMEARSIIGPYEGSKPREVLMSLEFYQAQKGANRG